MEIYPAIDLSDGKCVRLYQGDFDKETVYGQNPGGMVQKFYRDGARWVHVVDLDGARTGKPVQIDTILTLAQSSPVPLQVGGGIRDRDRVEQLLDGGVKRVIIGSKAVKSPAEVHRWIYDFGAERVAVALDVQVVEGSEPLVAKHGWQESSDKTLWDLLDELTREACLVHLLCTDISRDGTLGGTNVELYREICTKWPDLSVQASGGVSSLDDIRKVKATGVTGVVVGKALYEEKFTLKEALEC